MEIKRESFDEVVITTIVMTIFIVLTGYAFIFSDRGYLKYRKLKEKELILKEEIKELEIKKLFVQQRVKSLNTSKHLYESIAREKLEMVKSGETVFQIEYTGEQ